MVGRLAIVDSDETRQFLVDNVMGEVWGIEWIGAYQSDETLYNVDGSSFNTAELSDNFYEDKPGSTDYGLALLGSGYSGELYSYESSHSAIGGMIVEYQAIPEPATFGMLAGAGLLLAAYRRFFGRV